MLYNNIELNVLIKGKPITEYPHNGQLYVEGREGSNFEIEVRNNTQQRVEAVLAVDGLSIIDGKDAGPNSSGYLVEARSSIRIPGWKLNDQAAAAFTFAGKEGAYSTAMTGSNRNTGVIGLMAFSEKRKAYDYTTFAMAPMMKGLAGSGMQTRGITASTNTNPMWFGSSTCSDTLGGGTFTNSISPSVSVNEMDLSEVAVSACAQNLGTGFGEAQDFNTSVTTFERGDLLAMMVLYYDNARGLKARGIDLSKRSRRRDTQTPVAFPGMNCSPPPGWQG